MLLLLGAKCVGHPHKNHIILARIMFKTVLMPITHLEFPRIESVSGLVITSFKTVLETGHMKSVSILVDKYTREGEFNRLKSTYLVCQLSGSWADGF